MCVKRPRKSNPGWRNEVTDKKKTEQLDDLTMVQVTRLFESTTQSPDSVQLTRMTAKLKEIPAKKPGYGWRWVPLAAAAVGGIVGVVWWASITQKSSGTEENNSSELQLAVAEISEDPSPEDAAFNDWGGMEPLEEEEWQGFDLLLPPDVDGDEAQQWVDVLDEVLQDLK